MATLVEVTQKKPAIQDVTLKLTAGEIGDLKMFISDWYRTNYPYGADSKRDNNTVYKAIRSAQDGQAEAVGARVKIAANPF